MTDLVISISVKKWGGLIDSIGINPVLKYIPG